MWVEQESIRLTPVGMGTHQAPEKGRDWRGIRAGFWHSKVRDRHLGHTKKKEPRGFTDGGRCLLQDKWNQHLYTSKHYAVLESTLKRNIWWRGKLNILWTETANFSRKNKTVNTISSQPRWSLSQLLGSNYHKKQAQTVCKQECGPEFVNSCVLLNLWKNMLPIWKLGSKIPSARKKGPPHFSWFNNSCRDALNEKCLLQSHMFEHLVPSW